MVITLKTDVHDAEIFGVKNAHDAKGFLLLFIATVKFRASGKSRSLEYRTCSKGDYVPRYE